MAMISAYLYNIEQNKLTSLDAAGLLATAPSPQAPPGKPPRERDAASGGLQAAPAQCRDGEFVWVDVTAPTEEEFQLLIQRFGLHPLVVEDIKSVEGRPKLHDYGDYLFVIFHGVSLENVPEETTLKGTPEGRFDVQLIEIDCLVGRDYVVTIHQEPLQPFDDLRRRWQRHPELMRPGTPYLLYEIMDEVLDDFFPLLDKLDERIDDFEDRLFTNFEERLSSDIFSLKRNLLEIRHVAGPTRDVVNILLRHNAERGGQHFAYFQDLYDHAVRIVDMIDTFRDILSGALDAYLAIESNRMNAVMKTLTSASIILLIPTLIAGVYGMNFTNMPELHSRYGYFIVLGIMAATMMGLAMYFRRKDWL